MDGLGRVYHAGVNYTTERYVPTSPRHFVTILITTVISFLVIDFLLDIRLFRWIYWGTVLVIGLTLFYGEDRNSEGWRPL